MAGRLFCSGRFEVVGVFPHRYQELECLCKVLTSMMGLSDWEMSIPPVFIRHWDRARWPSQSQNGRMLCWAFSGGCRVHRGRRMDGFPTFWFGIEGSTFAQDAPEQGMAVMTSVLLRIAPALSALADDVGQAWLQTGSCQCLIEVIWHTPGGVWKWWISMVWASIGVQGHRWL